MQAVLFALEKLPRGQGEHDTAEGPGDIDPAEHFIHDVVPVAF